MQLVLNLVAEHHPLHQQLLRNKAGYFCPVWDSADSVADWNSGLAHLRCYRRTIWLLILIYLAQRLVDYVADNLL